MKTIKGRLSNIRHQFGRRPSLAYALEKGEFDPHRRLKRTLGWFDVAMLGVSVSVGAGIFSVGAKVITQQAGPSAILSFILCAIVCGFACMCYGEFASKLPLSGSSYTFSYFSLGEAVAWIIGWNILLEMFMSSAIILKYWSIYLSSTFRLIGIDIHSNIILGGINIDWPVFFGALLFTILLVRGTKLSAKAATVFVIIKIGVIGYVVLMGAQFFKIENLTPFIPPERPLESGNALEQTLFSAMLGGAPTAFGVLGIFTGAATIFFAYVGFDIAASAAEEVKNPKRNMPIGLIIGLGIVTILYVSIAVVTAGIVTPDAFAAWHKSHPEASPSLATAFEVIGQTNIGAVISFGAFCGLTTVVLICMMGVSRIVFAMSRDGLFPRQISKTSKWNTPLRIQVGVGVTVALVTAFSQIDMLSEMINIGTLSAFIIVSFSIPVLRKRFKPAKSEGDDKNEHFEVPLGYVFPVISGLFCLWLALNLQIATWLIFGVWVLLGAIFYFAYSRRHSMLEQNPDFVA